MHSYKGSAARVFLAFASLVSTSCSKDEGTGTQSLSVDSVYRDTILPGQKRAYSFVPTATGPHTVYAFHYLQGSVDCICNLSFIYEGKSTYSNNTNVFPIADAVANRTVEFTLSNPGGDVTFDLIVVQGDGSQGSIAAPKEVVLSSTYEIDISNQQPSYYSFQTTTAGVYKVVMTRYYRACAKYHPSNDIRLFSDADFAAELGLSDLGDDNLTTPSLAANTRYYLEAFVDGTEFCKTNLTVSPAP